MMGAGNEQLTNMV